MATRYKITETVSKATSTAGVAGVLQVGAGVSVTIKDLRGNNLTVYTAEIGATTTANPVTTDSAGREDYWVEAPDYDISHSGGGITAYTQKIRQSPQGHFNVKSYGARGDGTTDDTAAIQAAITAAGVSGCVYIPPGTFLCGTLTIASYAYILGAGWAASILKAKAGTTNVINGPEARYVQLRDFSVRGQSIAAKGINLDSATNGLSANSRLINVEVESCTTAFSLTNNGDTVMDGCIAQGANGVDVSWRNDGGNTQMHNCFFDGGGIQYSAQTAVFDSCLSVGGIKAIGPCNGPTTLLGGYYYANPTTHRVIDATPVGAFIQDLICDGTFFVTFDPATHTAGYAFDGNFGNHIGCDGCWFTNYQTNSGNAFGASFAAANAGAAPLIEMTGGSCVVSTGGGYAGTFWNEPAAAVMRYHQFINSTSGADYVRDGSRAITPTLGANWATLAGYRVPVYYKDHSGVVHVEGLAQASAIVNNGDVIFTLPVGYRPSGNVVPPGSLAVWVGANGQITWQGGNGAPIGSNAWLGHIFLP